MGRSPRIFLQKELLDINYLLKLLLPLLRSEAVELRHGAEAERRRHRHPPVRPLPRAPLARAVAARQLLALGVGEIAPEQAVARQRRRVFPLGCHPSAAAVVDLRWGRRNRSSEAAAARGGLLVGGGGE